MPIPQLRNHNSESWRNRQPSHRSKTSGPRQPRKLAKKLFITVLLAAVVLIIGVSIYAAIISRGLPNPNQLINRDIAQSTKIYDRTGQTILYEISGDQKRTLVQLKDIPDRVKQATIAIEDKNFYKHGGFSVWAMLRTAVTNVIFHRSAGGSTLTQQFIKNAVLTNEKTITRKIKELILSYRLEKKFSKDEILQMYLNEIPYGSNAYGVEAASQKYFGKDVQNITLPEAAILAAIIQSPTYYSPYGTNKDLLLSRKDYVLDLMAEQGYISTAERDTAKKEEIKFRALGNNMTAPHFVMYIKDLLTEKYGEKMVEQGGLKIITTLDLFKQQAAEEAVVTITKDYPTKFGANNAALVAIDPKTGQILAMVGSRDYFDDSIDGQVNVATRPRQPGSSMKPIVYAALFEKGYTPNTILFDVNTNFSTDPANPYAPHDYDSKERGPVSIRQALAGSLNIPAVKAIYLADINNVLDLADNLGYSTLYPRSRFGLSLVLGGGEVKLLEHTNAYSAFARDGQISPTTGILKVEDKNGNTIEEYQPSSKQALSPQVAQEINSILTDNNARAFIFGLKNYLTLSDRLVGAKTGTTNDFHDAWAVGYTPSLVAGVWVGNNNNKAMKGKADGSVLAAPIWHEFMAKVLTGTPVETFKAPADYTTGKPILDGKLPPEIVNIDKSSGLLATSSTPPELIEQRSTVAYHDILYYIDKNNPLGPAPANPAQDPQFNLWEKAVQAWASKNASSSTTILPTSYDTLHNPSNSPTLSILSPLKNQSISQTNLEVQIEATAPRGISRVEYYINNNLWETKWGVPTIFTKDISFLNNGYHSLTAKACDDVENCSSASVNFNLLIKDNPVNALKNTIKINSTANNQPLAAANFPLQINLLIGKPGRTNSINLIARHLDNGALDTIKIINSSISASLETTWDSPPPVGTYALYAELHDWNGDIIKSNEINISIQQ